MAASTRITHGLLVLVLLALLTVIGTLAAGVRGGPLDPPGSPASTDSVRLPGTPISSLPFAINAPGHYYLTHNLTGAEDINGITINASSVTLDLGGFELAGSGTASGIAVPGPQSDIRIYNGIIRNWTEGVIAPSAVRSRVDGITVTGTAFRGILLGGASVIEDCNVSSNSGEGIRAEKSIVRHCVIADNFSSGLVLSDSNYVHDNLATNNNLSATNGFADILVNGGFNYMTENQIGFLLVNGSSNYMTENQIVLLTFHNSAFSDDARRNGICGVEEFGTANDAPYEYQDIENSAGHFVPFPEANADTCGTSP